MKRFFCLFVMAVIFAAGLFAETKITEKQIETFIENGIYIKIVTKNDDGLVSVKYHLKQNVSCIFIQSNNLLYVQDFHGDNAEILDLNECEVYFDKNNIIFIKNKTL